MGDRHLILTRANFEAPTEMLPSLDVSYSHFV